MSEEKFIPISDPKEAVKALNQITEMYNERGLVISSLKARIKELEEKSSLYEWEDIKDFKRNRVVFIYYKNDLGKGRTVKALYVGKYEVESEFSIAEFTEYDETTDQNYWPEGWCEDVEAYTGSDYSYHHLGDINPTHFMALPTPPTQEGDK